MNVYSTSSIMSTDITRLEKELITAQEIGARPETIKSIQERLQKVKEEKSDEEKNQGIEHVKSWSNHYLLKRYDEVTKQGEELFENNNAAEFEVILEQIEQIEIEGRERNIAPFIPDEEFEQRILIILAETTITDGFTPARKIAEKISYPTDKVKESLEKLYNAGRILRYGEEEDLWAVSVAMREHLGIISQVKKPIESGVIK